MLILACTKYISWSESNFFNIKSETIIVSDIKLFSKKKTKFLEKSFRSIPSKKKKKKKKKKKQKKKTKNKKNKNYVT